MTPYRDLSVEELTVLKKELEKRLLQRELGITEDHQIWVS